MPTEFFVEHCKSALQTKPTKSLRCCRYTNSQPSLKNSCSQLNFVLLKYAFLTMQSENNKFKHILILWPWIMKVVGNVALNNSFNYYNRKIPLGSEHDYILFWVSFFSMTERAFDLKCHILRSFPVVWGWSQEFWLAKHRAA